MRPRPIPVLACALACALGAACASDRAIARSRAFAGMPAAAATAEQVPAGDVPVPFLGSRLAGQLVWKVHLRQRVDLPFTPAADGFDVWVADDGSLLRISSTPSPAAEVSLKDFEAMHGPNDAFEALSPTPPPVPLTALLPNVGTLGDAVPGRQALDAFLARTRERPAAWTWVVRARGYRLTVCPPPPGDGRDSPCTRHDTSWLLTFDAATGELLGESNSPDTCAESDTRIPGAGRCPPCTTAAGSSHAEHPFQAWCEDADRVRHGPYREYFPTGAGVRVEGEYRHGLEHGFWIHWDAAPGTGKKQLARVERFQLGERVEQVVLAEVSADLSLLDPLGQRPLPEGGTLPAVQARFREDFRRILERWAPAAGAEGSLWVVLQRGRAERHLAGWLVHRLAHRRFHGVWEGSEDVGRPEATARFRALAVQRDLWLLEGGGDEPLRQAMLRRADFPAGELVAELGRHVEQVQGPQPAPGETARLTFAQWCRVPAPAHSPRLERAVRSWYGTHVPLWRGTWDASLCAARALARWGGDERLAFLVDRAFLGVDAEAAVAAVWPRLTPQHAGLVRRAYRAMPAPEVTNPELQTAPDALRAVLIDRAQAWDAVVEDLSSRNVVRIHRALRLAPHAHSPEVDAALDELIDSDFASFDASGASPGWGPPDGWRNTAKGARDLRDGLRRAAQPFDPAQLVDDPFPPPE